MYVTRACLPLAAWLAVMILGCDVPPPKKAAQRPEPSGTVEGGYVHQMRREYDRDVIAYEKKYQGKWVLLRIQRPFTISKSYDDYGILQEMTEGDPKSCTFVQLRKADADRLSAILDDLQKWRKEEAMPRLRVRVKEGRFGFEDGQLVGK